ncbi:MAG: uL15 family ribosomal protein [Candidatus Hadarchaeum sp.]|uniref:uL15m family ribosomal protein n=1 Tax=Candidatus Hadarchaeum sp. TaxID=2883567 RepID=UPI00317260E7
MTVRRGRKVRKQRGRRTYGRGCSKRGRGSGERGGTGMSGGHKHKWSYIIRYMPDYFGKHGFTRPEAVRRGVTAINVGEIDENLDRLVGMGVAKKEGDRFLVDLNKLGVDKVLGGGRVTRPLEVVAKSFVESAKRKLEEAGGKAIAG